MCSAGDNAALPALGFPIRASTGQRLFSASPWLIAAVHALHRLLVPRHPPCALTILTVIRPIAIPVPHKEVRRISSGPVIPVIQPPAYRRAADVASVQFSRTVERLYAGRGGHVRTRSFHRDRACRKRAPVSQNSTACRGGLDVAPPISLRVGRKLRCSRRRAGQVRSTC
jgi:hypothetical protein